MVIVHMLLSSEVFQHDLWLDPELGHLCWAVHPPFSSVHMVWLGYSVSVVRYLLKCGMWRLHLLGLFLSRLMFCSSLQEVMIPFSGMVSLQYGLTIFEKWALSWKNNNLRCVCENYVPSICPCFFLLSHRTRVAESLKPIPAYIKRHQTPSSGFQSITGLNHTVLHAQILKHRQFRTTY